MEFVNITIGMLILQAVNYFLYKNPYKIVELKRKLRINRGNRKIYNRRLESEYIVELDMLRRRYMAKMTVMLIFYGVYVIAKLLGR